MKHTIHGTTMPVLQMELEPGEKIVAEPGEFSWMTDNVQLKTTTQAAGAKGLFSVLGRAMSGGGLFMTEYTSTGGTGMISFSAKVPGTIHQLDIAAGHSYMIHKHGFLCATEGVQLSIGFQKGLGAGLFGGNGFILQKLSGPCSAFVELGGECVTYDLAAGQTMLVHPGHIGMFQDTVSFEITTMRGIKNAIFGGDGLFIGKLTGPGKIWLQSMTVPGLAHAVEPYISTGESTSSNVESGIAGGIAGSILKSIFKG
jgi:uncharacterized protein (TIGR00266 family)